MTGDTFDDAAAAAAQHAAESGAVMVAPFDDVRTIAGQGTVVRELLQQLGRPPDAIVVPVGGGGLLAGVVTYLRERAPQVRVIGAEPAGAPSMRAALDGGRAGAAGQPRPVRRRRRGPPGRRPALPDRRRRLRCELVAVDEGAICTEMLGLYQNEGIVAEPAGALAATALRDAGPDRRGRPWWCIVSGGNNDVSRYGEILERSLVHLGLKHYFLVNFPQEPGALRRFLDEVLGPDDDITLFEYVKRNNRETGPALVGIEIGSADGLPGLLERMAAASMEVERILPGSAAYRYLT